MTVVIVPETFNFPFSKGASNRRFSFHCVSLLKLCRKS